MCPSGCELSSFERRYECRLPLQGPLKVYQASAMELHPAALSWQGQTAVAFCFPGSCSITGGFLDWLLLTKRLPLMMHGGS